MPPVPVASFAALTGAPQNTPAHSEREAGQPPPGAPAPGRGPGHSRADVGAAQDSGGRGSHPGSAGGQLRDPGQVTNRSELRFLTHKVGLIPATTLKSS